MTRPDLFDTLGRGVRAYILLFVLTFTAAVPGVFTMPTLDRDEARFAQASKQMLETGDYLKIRYQDGERNKKPAGIHWLQSASTAIFSSAEAKQIWSYRLPSLLGAALAACATFWVGGPLIGRRAAFIGSALFGVTLLLTSEAHISKTDAVLVAITTLSMGALMRVWKGDTSKTTSLLFWFAMGFGFLIKGPVTPMVAGLAAALLVVWERRWHWLKPLAWWPGPALFVAMVLPWFLAIQFATEGEFFRGAVGKDLKDKVVGASEGHGGLPGYHLSFLTSHFFPATLFLVPALVALISRFRHSASTAEENAGLRFLVAWLVPTWLVFELLPTKLSHYILPAYPALGLIVGWGAIQLIQGEKRRFSAAASTLLFLLAAGALAFIATPFGTHMVEAETAADFKTVSAETVMSAWSAQTSPIITLVPAALLVLLTAIFMLGSRYRLAVLAAVISSVALGWHIRINFLPNQLWVQPTRVAIAALEEVCGLPNQEGCETSTPTTVHAIGYAEPSFVFEAGTGVFISPYSSTELPPVTETPVAAYLVNLEEPDFGQGALEIIQAQADAQNRCVRVSADHFALNYSNGDPARFVGVVVDPAPCQS